MSAGLCARTVTVNGDSFLVLDPLITDLTGCAFVLDVRDSSDAWRELGSLTMADSTVIASAVVVLWAIAWGVRAILKLF